MKCKWHHRDHRHRFRMCSEPHRDPGGGNTGAQHVMEQCRCVYYCLRTYWELCSQRHEPEGRTLFSLEVEGSRFFRNVGNFIVYYTSSYQGRNSQFLNIYRCDVARDRFTNVTVSTQRNNEYDLLLHCEINHDSLTTGPGKERNGCRKDRALCGRTSRRQKMSW